MKQRTKDRLTIIFMSICFIPVYAAVESIDQNTRFDQHIERCKK